VKLIVTVIGLADAPSSKEKGLEINREKTRVVDVRKLSLDFLGYTFRYDRPRQGRRNTRYLNVIPSKKALALESRMREIRTSGSMRGGAHLRRAPAEHALNWLKNILSIAESA
jgi:hypothetical protein